MIKPLVHEINYQDPHTLFAQFAKDPYAILLESAQQMAECGQFSFVAVDPFLTIVSKNDQVFLNEEEYAGNPWDLLAEQLAQFTLTPHVGLPPFQGGAAGLFGYDLHQQTENVFSTQQDDLQCPDMAVGFYDLVIGFDHLVQQAFIFSSGQHAQARLSWLLQQLAHSKKIENKLLPVSIKTTQHFTQEKYYQAVEKVKNYIRAGDIFQANISQRFDAVLSEEIDTFILYEKLRFNNPAPFSAYFVLQDGVVVSASPERFLKVTNNIVETRPIKGTRARGKTAKEDEVLANELCQSEKDRAENIMIVDLMRNDLSRVCEPHSVQVPKLCGLESYQTVHHLVSVVKGKLKPSYRALDLLKVAFPGGSITGAPKIRAMEVIAEIEPTRRGVYCGSIGYFGFDGAMDTSILIRTFFVKKNHIVFQAGGAVTLNSDPVLEYEEVLTKAKALRAVLNDSVD